jgi:putative oxidoreductase
MLNRPLPAPARDIAMLIARVILGVVLFAHGWQKLMINGIAGTYGQFEKLGIPLAIVSASFASFVEFVGGVLIVVGALTTTVVALDLIVMVGAAGFVHMTNGIFAQNGGWELVGVIVAAELALAGFGPGRFSVDHLIARRRDRERAEMERRKRTPVTKPAAVSENFTPASEARPGGFVTDPGTGAFAALAPMTTTPPTGAFTDFTPAPTPAPSEAEQPSATSSTDAFHAISRTADQPVTEAFATVSVGSLTGEPAPSVKRSVFDTSPRMASAGVCRAMSEQAAGSDRPAPAPFGVIVQSPLDFTPTTALPIVPPAEVVGTDTITIATSGLPRRVRAVDLPPASAVRPYA